ncbi:MAG: cobalt-precorrin 5A hydrolase [Spirochaetes bacterium]|nr:cobalt-precorrin 5A hydrolase [Spirochaetota bacterium]
MKKSVIAITKKGIALGEKIVNWNSQYELYLKAEYYKGKNQKFYGSVMELVKSLFQQSRSLIFICATGIAVRAIAPLLKDKTRDPAVLVIDEQGRFVISLLSGHLGGANAEASEIAAFLNAQAVITTASDLNQKISIDLFAKNNHLLIDNMEMAKTLTAMLVNEEKVAMISDISIAVPDYLNLPHNQAKGIIYIGNRQKKFNIPAVRLIPKNIILGLGCRKGKPGNDIINFIKTQLKAIRIDPGSIQKIGTINIKEKEAGILETAQYFHADLVFYSKDQLNQVAKQFKQSEFAFKTTGTGNVSEASAFLAGQKRGTFLLKKAVSNGITLSVFQTSFNYEEEQNCFKDR